MSASWSGSELPLPSRTIWLVGATVIEAGVAATGARSCTVIVTLEAGDVICPLDTVSWNVIVPDVPGAVKVGFAVVELLSVAAGPAVCAQLYVSGWPSASLLPEPSSETVACLLTVCPLPAAAVGWW